MAKKGRKPTPTALLELRGTANVTRMKARAQEPEVSGDLDAPPPWMSAEQKDHWRYAVENAPVGVLGAIDHGALAVYVVAYDQHRVAVEQQTKVDVGNGMPLLTTIGVKRTKKANGDEIEEGGTIMQSPYLGIINRAGLRMLKAASELGFTPAARPRLSAGMGNEIFTPAPKVKGAGPDENLERYLAQRPDTLQ